jgi:HD superfamily phosphohydrolase YqeK
VGVAVVDRTAGVGGLYHILLPEHSSALAPPVDEIYAKKGLPLFLQALRAAGCTEAGMEVTLAGGALTGNVSVHVSQQEEIRSIDQALIMLGARLVAQLVLSSALNRFFKRSQRGYSMSKGGLYHPAVSTAIVSEQISRLTGRGEPDIAYSAGLLHDIGKVLLDQYAAPALPLFYRRIYSEGEDLLDVERSLIGITHEEAGTRLAELWAFPPSLKDAVAFHSRPELAQHDPDLAHVVYLADLLIARFDAGHEMERIGTNGLEKRLHQLGLRPDSLPGIIAQIPWEVLNIPGYF